MRFLFTKILLLVFIACKKDAFLPTTPPSSVSVPPWLLGHHLFVYGSPDIDYLQTIRATATTWGVFFRGVNEEEKSYVDMIQNRGFHVLSNFSTQGYEYLVAEEGLEERSACLTLDGKKAQFFWALEDSKPWVTCNNNPEWSDSLHKRIVEHVLAGVHGVHIDEVEGIAGFLFVAGFCPYDMSGFRKHLRENFPNPEDRRKKFGEILDNLDSFDYGEYLGGIGKTLKDDPNRVLKREFVLFQMLARRRQIESLVRTAKHAGGINLTISANTTFLSPHKQIFIPNLDLTIYEMFMVPPPAGRYITMHLWGKEIDPNKPFVIFPVSVNMLGFTADDWPLITFWMLEALASGQSFLVPFDAYTGCGPRYTVPAEPLAPVGKFIEEFNNHFHNPKPIADVAVLYDLATGLEEFMDGGFAAPISPGNMDKSLLGIGRSLQEAHIPYAVLYVGDGRFVDKMPSANNLATYSVIIMPNVPYLRSDMRSSLQHYQQQGGKSN